MINRESVSTAKALIQLSWMVASTPETATPFNTPFEGAKTSNLKIYSNQ